MANRGRTSSPRQTFLPTCSRALRSPKPAGSSTGPERVPLDLQLHPIVRNDDAIRLEVCHQVIVRRVALV